MSQTTNLSKTNPGGCYLGFNAGIDRKAAEQVVSVVNDCLNNGFTEVNLCMSSVGGILDHTYYAFTMLEALSVKIITWNTGNIQSAANLLFLCGDERYATPGSTFFFHQTGYDPPPGRVTENNLSERLKAVRYDDNRSASIIAAKTGRPLQEVRGWQNMELVMDAVAAQAQGLIRGIKTLAIPADALFFQIVI